MVPENAADAYASRGIAMKNRIKSRLMLGACFVMAVSSLLSGEVVLVGNFTMEAEKTRMPHTRERFCRFYVLAIDNLNNETPVEFDLEQLRMHGGKDG